MVCARAPRKLRNESRASLWRVVNYKRTLQFVSGGPGKPFCFFHFYATSSMERQWNATSKLQLLLMGRRKLVSSGHATLAIQDDGTSWLSHIDRPNPGAASRDGSFSAIVHGTAVSKRCGWRSHLPCSRGSPSSPGVQPLAEARPVVI